eukprot:gene6278-1121_t
MDFAEFPTGGAVLSADQYQQQHQQQQAPAPSPDREAPGWAAAPEAAGTGQQPKKKPGVKKTSQELVLS